MGDQNQIFQFQKMENPQFLEDVSDWSTGVDQFNIGVLSTQWAP